MVYPVGRPTSRRVRTGTVLGTIFLLSVVAPGLARGQAGTGGPYDAARLLEIRPAGGKVVGTGADLMPQSILERVRNVPHVVQAEGYLFVGVMDKTKQTPFGIIGGTVPGAAFRVNCHNVDAVRIVEGRGLEAQDARRMVAIVGRRYAETFAPAGQSKIRVGAVISLIRPGMDTGGVPVASSTKVQVVGIFSAGFPLGDSQVLLPLDTAQKLFGLEGKISKVVVTIDAPGAREKASDALFARLGEDVDVVTPRQGGMRGMP